MFEHPLRVRYMEVDAQGVVFNAWYLTYFDEAMAAFLADRGLPYPAMLAAGFDVQLVRSEIDWRGGLRWPEDFRVAVATARLGRTSFALDFEARRGDVLRPDRVRRRRHRRLRQARHPPAARHRPRHARAATTLTHGPEQPPGRDAGRGGRPPATCFITGSGKRHSE